MGGLDKLRERSRKLCGGDLTAHFLDGRGVLAQTGAEVIELGATDFPALGHFDLGYFGGMDREHPLHAFTIGNLTDGEVLADADAQTSDDDACEDLNPLFAAFNNAAVDFNGVTNVHWGNVGLHLLLVDFLDLVHN